MSKVLIVFMSSAGHVLSRMKIGGPPSNPKYLQQPIANSTVRER